MFGRSPKPHSLASVTRGAAMLDKYLPGWHNHINTGPVAFSITSPENCVLGQLDDYSREKLLGQSKYGRYVSALPYKRTISRLEAAGARYISVEHYGFNAGYTKATSANQMRLAWAYEVWVRTQSDKIKAKNAKRPLRLVKVQDVEHVLAA